MSGRGLLDADMHSLGRMAAQGWRWWLDELRQLLPAGLRPGRHDALPRIVFHNGRLESGAAGPGVRAAIVIPRALCLTRILERPSLTGRDLQNMLALEAEALLPFPSESLVIAGRIVGPAADRGRVLIEVAGLSMEVARTVMAATESAGVVPVRMLMQAGEDRGGEIDFAPALREAGLLTRPRSVTPLLWAGVGFLAALNLGALIWRDMASVARIEQIVEEQEPAVAIARTMEKRTGRDRALVATLVTRRRGHDALGGLVAVSRALPEGVWLQRYVWDGASVRMAGYKPPRVDVATALRRSGRFTQVRSMADEMQATVPTGDPFDLTAGVIQR
ncbi:MAG TPA: hypothetical protein VF503_06005 [Sphingobium sp.]|uniref:hypothetical protein n=1 Tax=Sphingobium sp. TaxID=1912891 RepID=UPI002ED542B6